MQHPDFRRLALLSCAGGVALWSSAPTARAQVTSLPFSFVDVADDPLAPDDCGVAFTFTDPDPLAGIDSTGVSVADYDGDGFLDIFFPAALSSPNKLFRNLGNGHFTDVAALCGVADPASSAAAALFLDYDHDGDLDLFVCSHLGKPGNIQGPKFKLFRNEGAAGDHHFIDVTAGAGFVLGNTAKLTNWGWVSGICAGDYNHDGYVDLFTSWNASGISTQDQWRLMRNAPNPVPGDPNDPNYTPRIFIDATPASGLQGEFGGEPWMPLFLDVNRDGWPDLHINQDFAPDLMFINNHNGTWTNVATPVGLNGNPPENRNEMGVAPGDPDNDLDIDLHLTNQANKDRFYRNDSVKGTLSFTDIAPETGLNNTEFGWGTAFFDMDNDGDQDHASVADGEHDLSKPYFSRARLNLFPETYPDGNVKWQDISALLPEFTMVNTPLGGSVRGLAIGDLDNDGDIDMVVSRNVGVAGVFRNTLVSDNHWLEVNLVNSGGSLDATGTRVYVRHAGVTQMREQFTGSSYLSQESSRLHFGLGGAAPYGTLDGAGAAGAGSSRGKQSTIGAAGSAAGGGGASGKPDGGPTWLVVRWTDGACQIVKHPLHDQILTVTRSAVNDTGDLDADGHLTPADAVLLALLVQDPAAFQLAHPASPGVIVGDVDDNGVLDADDVTAWSALPPH